MNRLHTLITMLCLLLLTQQGRTQVFHELFADSTLRIDYVFSGNRAEQHIAVDQLNMSPGWYGKHHRLTGVPMEGNGQITVRSHATGKVVYRNSFSTLFQEWLSYNDSQGNTQSFENVFLVPYPKDTVDITVELRDNRRTTTCSLTHTVVPQDILIRHIGTHHVTPYEVVQQAHDEAHAIHIAFVAEGYQEQEMETFMEDVRIATEAIFEHEPFKEMRQRFTIVAVKSPSADSGTSEPAKGIWKKTALSSHFDTFHTDRYLTTLHLKDLHDVLAGIPYEHIIVLVNTDKYGGGGILNSYNLSMTHHRLYKPVVVHEFGHSFAGLGDEYAYEDESLPMYPADIEPWEANLTTLTDFHGKWEDMISRKTKIPTPLSEASETIGVYEGAGYQIKGVYRGAQDCRMKTNGHPEFCAICQRAIRNIIHFYTEP